MVKGAQQLILGGHSFIKQLGNDALLSEQGQIELVEHCLDCGIRWFDTTYQPERVSLGRALHNLGRRKEATIAAWSFFSPFDPDGSIDRPVHYRREHIDVILDELQTDCVDSLVIHGMNDDREDRRQEDLVVEWRERGLVKRIGVWRPDSGDLKRHSSRPVYEFMVCPRNIVNVGDVDPIFEECKEAGWETHACSPFVRGWELDKLSENAASQGNLPSDELKQKVADLMFRFALYGDNVDKLIVAMRHLRWVDANIASAAHGPLSPDELEWLRALTA